MTDLTIEDEKAAMEGLAETVDLHGEDRLRDALGLLVDAAQVVIDEEFREDIDFNVLQLYVDRAREALRS